MSKKLLENTLIFGFIAVMIFISIKGYVLHDEIKQDTIIIKRDSVIQDTTKLTKFDDSIR